MPSVVRGCSVTRHAHTPGSAATPGLADGLLDSPTFTHETWVTAPVDITSRDADPDYESPESVSSHASSEEPDFLRAARAVAKRNAALRRSGRSNSTSVHNSGETLTPASQQSVGMSTGMASSSHWQRSSNGARNDEGAAMLQSIIQRASARLNQMGKSQEHKSAEEMLRELRGSVSCEHRGEVGAEGDKRGEEQRAAGRVESPARSRTTDNKVEQWLDGSGRNPSSSATKSPAPRAKPMSRVKGQVTMMDLIHRAAERLEALEGAGQAKSAEQMLKELKGLPCAMTQGGCEVHLLDGEQLEAVMRSYAPSESDLGAPSEASTTLEELLAAGGHHPGHKSAVALLQELRGHMRPTGSASGHVAQEVPSNMSSGVYHAVGQASSSKAATSNGGAHPNMATRANAGNILTEVSPKCTTPKLASAQSSKGSCATEELGARDVPVDDDHKSSEQLLRELKGQSASKQGSAGGGARSQVELRATTPPMLTASNGHALTDAWSEDASEASTSIEELVAARNAELAGNYKSADKLLKELKSEGVEQNAMAPPARQASDSGGQGSNVPPSSMVSPPSESGTSQRESASEASAGIEQLLADRMLPVASSHKSANELLSELRGQTASTQQLRVRNRNVAESQVQSSPSNVTKHTKPIAAISDNGVASQHPHQRSSESASAISPASRFHHALECTYSGESRDTAAEGTESASKPVTHVSPPSEAESQEDSASEASSSVGQLLSDRMAALPGNHKSANDLLTELKGGARAAKQHAEATCSAGPLPLVQPTKSDSRIYSKLQGRVAGTGVPQLQSAASSGGTTPPKTHSSTVTKAGAQADSAAARYHAALERVYTGGIQVAAAEERRKSMPPASPHSEAESQEDTVSVASSAVGQLLTDRVAPLPDNHKSANDLLKELRGGAAVIQQSVGTGSSAPAAHVEPVISGSSSASEPQPRATVRSVPPKQHAHLPNGNTSAGSPAERFHDALERTYLGGRQEGVNTMQTAGVARVPSDSETDAISEASNGVERPLVDRVVPLGNNHKSANDLLNELRGRAPSPQPPGSTSNASPKSPIVGTHASAPPRQQTAVVDSITDPKRRPQVANDSVRTASPAERYHDALERAYFTGKQGTISSEDGSRLRHEACVHAPSESESQGDSASEASTAVEQLLTDRVAPLAANHKSASDVLKELRGGVAPTQQIPAIGSSILVMNVQPTTSLHTSINPSQPPQVLSSSASAESSGEHGSPPKEVTKATEPTAPMHAPSESESLEDSVSEASTCVEQLLADRVAQLSGSHKSANDLLKELKGSSGPAQRPSPSSRSQNRATGDAIGDKQYLDEPSSEAAAGNMSTPGATFEQMLAGTYSSGTQHDTGVGASPVIPYFSPNVHAHPLSDIDSASEASTTVEQLLADRLTQLSGNHKSTYDLLNEIRGSSPPLHLHSPALTNVTPAEQQVPHSASVTAPATQQRTVPDKAQAEPRQATLYHSNSGSVCQEPSSNDARNTQHSYVSDSTPLPTAPHINGLASEQAPSESEADSVSNASTEGEHLLADRAAPLSSNHKSAGDLLSELRGHTAAATPIGRPAVVEDDSSNMSPRHHPAEPDISPPMKQQPTAAEAPSVSAVKPSRYFQEALERSYKAGSSGDLTARTSVQLNAIAAVCEAREMAAAEEASEASTTVEDLLAAKAAALQDCSHKSAVALLRELRGEAALPQHVQQERSYLPPAFTGGGQPKSNGGAGYGCVAWESGVRRVYDSDSGSSSDETCSPLRLLTARAVEIENGHTSAEALLRELKQNADAKQRLAPVSIRPMASEPPPPAMHSPMNNMEMVQPANAKEQLPVYDGEAVPEAEVVMAPQGDGDESEGCTVDRSESEASTSVESLAARALEQVQAQIESSGIKSGEELLNELKVAAGPIEAVQEHSHSEASSSAESLGAGAGKRGQVMAPNGELLSGEGQLEELNDGAVVMEASQGCSDSEASTSVESLGARAVEQAQAKIHICDIKSAEVVLKELKGSVGTAQQAGAEGCSDSEASTSAESLVARALEQAQAKMLSGGIKSGEALLKEMKGTAGVIEPHMTCSLTEASTSTESPVMHATKQTPAESHSDGVEAGEALLQELKSVADLAHPGQGCSESEASTSAESLVARGIAQAQAKMQSSGIKSGEALLQELKNVAGMKHGGLECEASTSAESVVLQAMHQAQAKIQSGDIKTGEALIQELKGVAAVEDGCSESEASTSAESLVARGIAQAKMQSSGIKSGDAQLKELKNVAGMNQGCPELEASTSAESVVVQATQQAQAKIQSGDIKTGEALIQELKGVAAVEDGCSESEASTSAESLVARGIAQAQAKMQSSDIKSGDALLKELKNVAGMKQGCPELEASTSAESVVLQAMQQAQAKIQSGDIKTGKALIQELKGVAAVEDGCSESEASTSAESLVARGIAQAQAKMQSGGIKSGDALLKELKGAFAGSVALDVIASPEANGVKTPDRPSPGGMQLRGGSDSGAGSSGGGSREALLNERIEMAAASVEQIKHSSAHLSAEELLQELKAYGSYMSRSAEHHSPVGASSAFSSPASVHMRSGAVGDVATQEGCRELPSPEDSPEHLCALLLLKELRDRAAITQKLMDEYSGKSSTQSTPTKSGPGQSAGGPGGSSSSAPPVGVSPSGIAASALAEGGFGSDAGQREDGDIDADSFADYDTDSDLDSVTTYVSSTDGRVEAKVGAGEVVEEVEPMEQLLKAVEGEQSTEVEARGGRHLEEAAERKVGEVEVATREEHVTTNMVMDGGEEDARGGSEPSEVCHGETFMEETKGVAACEVELPASGDDAAEGVGVTVNVERGVVSAVGLDSVEKGRELSQGTGCRDPGCNGELATVTRHESDGGPTLEEQVLAAAETALKETVGGEEISGGRSVKSKRELLRELIHTATLRLREIEATRGQSSSLARLEQLRSKQGTGRRR